MRDYNLRLSPFHTLDTLSCHIKKCVNDHMRFEFCGLIQPEDEENFLNTGMEDIAVELSMVGEDGSEYLLCCGVARDIQIQREGDLRRLSVEAVSGTYYEDLVKYVRVFQDSSSTYDAVLKHNEKNYQDAGHSMMIGNGSTIGDLVVQYRETDWEFARRMASHFNSVVVPAYRTKGIHYYFGFPDGKQNIELSKHTYTIRKDAGDYLTKTKNQVLSLIEADALCLEVESRDVYEIGDSFPFQGQTYYIYEIESVLDGRELVHHYKLRSKAALQTIKQFNERMIGASLEANISGVSKDTVQVNIAADGIQSNRKWFLYSTVYSSPDGTGWYCMPEEGDSVRLYLPNEKEKDGYIISAVHVPADGEARSTPDNKSLKSKYGKEVLFTPSLLRLTNNNGMSVEISDEDGITISSDKAVTIEAKEGVQIASLEQSVEVVAPESIALKQGDTTLTMKDDIHLDGAQVHME